MDLQLTGQVAVVVGSAQGIGRAIADEFAKEGAQVALLDRAESVQATSLALAEKYRVRCLPIVCDATDYGAMQQAAARIAQELGTPRHLVFAVAIGSGKFGFPFWNLEPKDWAKLWEVNVLAGVHMAHAFAPALVSARAGTMLFLSSVAGQIGSQSDPPYSATKAALINFAQCAAKDLAPFNVRVNTICPGMVRTALNQSVWAAWEKQQPADKKLSYEAWTADKIQRVVPLNRWQEPEDVAALAVFLASARGQNITGQTLNVDGGFVIR